MSDTSWKTIDAGTILDHCPYFTAMFTPKTTDPSTLFFRLKESVETNQYEGEIQTWWDTLSNPQKVELFTLHQEFIFAQIDKLQDKLQGVKQTIFDLNNKVGVKLVFFDFNWNRLDALKCMFMHKSGKSMSADEIDDIFSKQFLNACSLNGYNDLTIEPLSETVFTKIEPFIRYDQFGTYEIYKFEKGE